jgi:hypothetical protein
MAVACTPVLVEAAAVCSVLAVHYLLLPSYLG